MKRRKLFFSVYVYVELIIFYFVFVLVLSCLVIVTMVFYLFCVIINVPFLYYLLFYNKLFVTNIGIYKMSIPFRESSIVEGIVILD